MRALTLTALVACLASGAAAPLSGQKTFSDSAAAIAIEVPVQVVRDGKPVRGLTRDDFKVFEGRREMPIVEFDVVDLAEVAPQPADGGFYDLPAGARRHFLLFFDLSFSDVSSISRARSAAYELVREGLHPSDLVGVATYAESRGSELVLAFTTDRLQLRLALDSLGLADPVERLSDPLKMIVEDLDSRRASSAAGLAPASGGRVDRSFIDDAWRELVIDLGAMNSVAASGVETSQVLALTESLGELAGYMESVVGRKHVVYLSEGFATANLLGTDDRERIAEIANQAASGEVWRVDSNERFGSGSTQGGLFDMLEIFRRADCTIQAVDIGGLRAGGDPRPRASSEESLFIMAEQTGGELYRNTNDLAGAMRSMLDRTAVTYVLVLATRIMEPDGSYHPIRVKLDKRLKGARAIHRPGYYAARPYSSSTDSARVLSAAQLIAAGADGGEIESRVSALPFVGDDGRAFVLTQLEIEGASLLRRHTGPLLPLEIYAYAIDEEGATRDFFTQAAVLDLAEVGEQLRSSGFKFLGRFDLAPGNYRVRTLVRHGTLGAHSIRTTSLEVPEVPPTAALLPPLFIEAPGAWVVGWQTGDEDPLSGYPLTIDGERLLPAREAVLFGGLDVPILLVGRNLGAELPIASGSLGGGGPVAIELEPAAGGAGGGLTTFRARLRADPEVAPGHYELVVTLTDPPTGARVESRTAVLVQ